MKKKLGVIVLAALTGCVLSFPILVKSQKNNLSLSLYALQVGAFEAKENALQKQKEYPDAIIFKDSKFYRVLLAASSKLENMEKLKKIFSSISFYQKELPISLEMQNKIKEYDLVLKNTEDEETIKLLNQKILEKLVS